MRYLQLEVTNWNDWDPEYLSNTLDREMYTIGYISSGKTYIDKGKQMVPYWFEYYYELDKDDPSINNIIAYLKSQYIDVNIEEIIID